MKEEGNITKRIEDQASKVHGDLYLWIGLGLLGASLILRLANRRNYSGFVGRLGESVLSLGLYNKKVKQQIHDNSSSEWKTPVESPAEMLSKNL